MPRNALFKPVRLTGAPGASTVIGLFLLAGAVAVSGCGESTSTSASVAQQSSSSTASTASSSTAPGTHVASTPVAGASSQAKDPATGSVAPAGRSRAHLVLPPAGSKPERKATASELANAAVADISLSSPAIAQAHSSSTYTLNRAYTCAGADRSPPLHWTGIPAGTQELALFVMSTVPVGGKLFFDWAVANLNPKLTGLSGGTLPAGAVLGRNGQGHSAYSVCPAGGKRESYVFVLYALPQKLSPASGFDPASLRKEAMQIARHTGLLVGSYG
jgi:phosphatidylethanolamine-binding protein (PEBP) family uncharacterized protein